MPSDMTFRGERGSVYLRETAPGVPILSWYPHSQADPGWPGTIIDTTQDPSFPTSAWERAEREPVIEWVSQHEWWQPIRA